MPGKAAASAKEILPGWEPGIDAGGICPLGADSAVDWPGTAGPAAGSGLRYGNPSQRSEVFNRAGRQNWPGGNLLKGKGAGHPNSQGTLPEAADLCAGAKKRFR